MNVRDVLDWKREEPSCGWNGFLAQMRENLAGNGDRNEEELWNRSVQGTGIY